MSQKEHLRVCRHMVLPIEKYGEGTRDEDQKKNKIYFSSQSVSSGGGAGCTVLCIVEETRADKNALVAATRTYVRRCFVRFR